MDFGIRTFTDKHVDSAAELLATRYRADRAREPDLSPRYEDPAEAATVLRHVFESGRTEGVVAHEGHRLAGFLLGRLHARGPGVSARVTVSHGAVAASQELGGEIYRELYAAVAPRWVAEHCHVHFISVLATDVTAVDAWFSLGFGQDTITGVRNTGAVAGREPANIEIRRGQLADVDAIVQLEDGLRSYQTGPPVFLPYAPERRAGMPRLHERLLADGTNAYWIAFRRGVPVGYQLFAPVPQGFPHLPDGCVYIEHAYTKEDERNGGVGTALLRRGMAWAREEGYEHCATDWVSSNLLAARFWPRRGFRPTSYVLCRRIDGQIARKG